MEPASMHQMMGYDRAITLFSPDGRLLQVEYAKKTVRQGSTAIGIVYKDGVLIVADKKVTDPLIEIEAVEKVFSIDKHIIAAAAGIISDARVLIEYARRRAQDHAFVYDTPIDVIEIVTDIANINQYYTQSGGFRPFGVSIIIGGIDEAGKSLFTIDPTGIYFKYKAYSIGEGEEEVNEYLRKNYKENMEREEALRLALKALKEYLKERFKIERIEAWYIDNERISKKIEKKELEAALKKR